jgi:hypothetical protein
MRIIEGQIMASTAIDRHGDQITEEQLTDLYHQQPIPWVMYVEHSYSKKPIARAINKSLVRLPTGTLALACDLEVWDEEELKKYGAVSIAIITARFTAIPNEDTPDIMLTFNPKVIDQQDAVSLIHLTDESVRIDVRTVVQKALDVPILVFIGCATVTVFNGFFSEMGKDIYRAVKEKMIAWGQKSLEEHGQELKCQFTFHYQDGNANPEIIVTVSSACLEELTKVGVTEAVILEEVRRVSDLRRVKKVSLTLRDMTPTWNIEYVIDVDDNVISVPARSLE